MKTPPKLYPFNADRYANEIEFARFRAYCLAADMRRVEDHEAAEIMEARTQAIKELQAEMKQSRNPNGIAWLRGWQSNFAKDMLLWAEREHRSRYRPSPEAQAEYEAIKKEEAKTE